MSDMADTNHVSGHAGHLTLQKLLQQTAAQIMQSSAPVDNSSRMIILNILLLLR